mgnify:CR=1 FL=1
MEEKKEKKTYLFKKLYSDFKKQKRGRGLYNLNK